ncbi:MAG: glycosyltransferase family 4 protein [Bacteroidales bacterium]|nr:glycosyltransferase family 4 protein [Bacteroidales bacterium]
MRILIIRYKLTRGVPEGGEQGSEKNLKVLQKIVGEENVETVYIHDESHRRTLWEYAQGVMYMPAGYYFGLTPKRVRRIAERAKAFDVVFVDRSVFGIVAKRLKESGYQGRVVCFFHNVETVYFAAKYSSLLNPLRWLTVHCADRNDRWSCRYADRTIALSWRDDEELHHRYGRHADELIPVAFEDRYQREAYPDEFVGQRPLCMFLGAYMPANVEGIEWFVKEVLPHTDIRILIVGKGMEKIREAEWLRNNDSLAGRSIEVKSNVPDLAPLFEEADIMVLPIFKGSGMKVKTCESLMYGKNIIGTTEAWSGYELDYQRAGACCETVPEFAEAIQRCIGRPRFNAYSREVFVEKYSADRMVEKFRAVIC